MLLSPRALKSLNCIEKTQLRIVWATFNGNPSPMIISCYSPTIASNETNITPFCDKLSFIAQHILKYNILIIGRDLNAQIGKVENNKFSMQNLPNRNGKYLTDFSLKNSLSCLNTIMLKHLDYILINRKWITKSSQQRYAWIDTEIRNSQNYKLWLVLTYQYRYKQWIYSNCWKQIWYSSGNI